MSPNKKSRLRLADRPVDYQRLGIDPARIVQFEDGQRVGTESGRYEWWYFDAHLNDGATVVVVFYTKPNSPSAFSRSDISVEFLSLGAGVPTNPARRGFCSTCSGRLMARSPPGADVDFFLAITVGGGDRVVE